MKAPAESPPPRRTPWSAQALQPETGAPTCGNRDPRSYLLRSSEDRRAAQTYLQLPDPPLCLGLGTPPPPSRRASLPFNPHSLRPAVQFKRLLSRVLAASR